MSETVNLSFSKLSAAPKGVLIVLTDETWPLVPERRRC